MRTILLALAFAATTLDAQVAPVNLSLIHI